MTNLSADGVGLCVREAFPQGRQVTVQFPLPELGGTKRLTATGIVRWSHASSAGRWHRSINKRSTWSGA